MSQRLFRRLAVFSGGCPYEAAEEVAGADPDTLPSLLDKSLLRKRDSKVGPRYWMLETIREYAAGRLDASGDADELRTKHAQWYLELAEEAYPQLTQSAEWLDRLDPNAVYLSVITIGEIRKGIEKLPHSKRKDKVREWLETDLLLRLEGRILEITLEVMLVWGALNNGGADFVR